jgi:hypothetical protein
MSAEVRVVLLREGLAKSGRYFSRRAVEDVARLANGARAFVDHVTPTEERERPVRSVRDLLGYYRAPQLVVGEDRRARVEATLKLLPTGEWVRELAGAAGAAPQQVVGLSIDSIAVVKEGLPDDARVGGRKLPVVQEVLELRSVDVVTRPSAGGRFMDVVQTKEHMEVGMDMETEGVTIVREVEELAPADGADGQLGAGADAARELNGMLQEVREAQLALACRRVLEEHLAAAERLPVPVRAKLRRQLAPEGGRVAALCGDDTDPTAEAYGRVVESAIREEAETLEAIGPLVTGYGAVRVTVAESEKQRLVAQIAMDRLLGFDGLNGSGQPGQPGQSSQEDPDWRRARELGLLPGAPRWMGIREAYVALTGDAAVSGGVFPESSIVREANEVTTGVLNHALLNSMTKRLVQDYRGQEQSWRAFCHVTPLANFRSQDRVRLHDFSSLSTVAEGAAYTNLAWDDSREAYAPAKRGNLVVITREAILNDDLRAIRRIPQKLSRAAAITMNEFVYGLFTGNPAMADGTKVFDDGVQTAHGNRGTAVLSSSALQAAITTMMKQSDTAGKRLNLKPRYLLVPADLLFTALTIVNSTLTPGTSNNDANVLKGAVEPIPVAQLTDATDWYLICDPQDIESIEIGFVGGKEEPELLLQDAPLHGQVFTNDQIAYKVRWEFGGAWLDYRGAFWSQAAG